MNEKIRVLVVDDSALARKMLTDLLNQHPEIDVVGTAQDGSFVMRKIEQLHPDVITLDVEMRQTGGLEILPEIVQTHNLPVIMVSAHTERGAEATFKALELGAVDFVTKPQAGTMVSLAEIVDELVQKIIAVTGSKRRITLPRPRPITPTTLAKPAAAPPPRSSIVSAPSLRARMIAIGASTGGTEAIKDVLIDLPLTIPGIVIVQHMPAGFTKAFSNRLNSICKIKVKEAEEGDEVQPGLALIAPGSHHVEVVNRTGRLKVRLLETPPVNRHRPSVEVLFNSVADTVGKNVLGVILTGMGADGADGLKNMRDRGALTVAQDEETCVVFGMPKEAIKRGGACHILPLDNIGQFLVQVTNGSHR